MSQWIKLNFELTSGLKAEMDTVNGWSVNRSIESMYPEVQSPKDFYLPETSTPGFGELTQFLKGMGKPLRILEVGAGIGRTSVYLANEGHLVSVLEPVTEQCRILHTFADKWNLPITVYEGTAEDADQIQKFDSQGFDLCFFNGALHHCDDPVRALKSCRTLIRPTGKVLLLNEPILKFFRSKKWYYHQLEVNPQAMGHYGGNEHIYYAWEYPNMIKKAGFKKIQMVPSRSITDFRGTVAHMATVNQCGRHIYTEEKLFLHTVWTYLQWKISKFPWASSFFSRLSLGPSTIEAAL